MVCIPNAFPIESHKPCGPPDMLLDVNLPLILQHVHCCRMVEEPAIDPIFQRAEELADKQLLKCSVHYQLSAWEADVKSRNLAQKNVCIIDSPTSKAKIVLEQLQLAHGILSQVGSVDNTSFLIPVGRRLDLLNVVFQKTESASCSKAFKSIYVPMDPHWKFFDKWVGQRQARM